jgi:valyl-tRNA synthetase
MTGTPTGASDAKAGPSLEKWSVQLEEAISKDLAARPIPFVGDGKRPVWSIDTPPPYPSGKWHIGAVAGYSLIDVIARSQRMRGFDVLFPWGVDRNGINIELTLEKKSGKRMQDFPGGREAFIAACSAEIQQYSDDMVRIAQRVGLSAAFHGKDSYATDAPEYRAFSQACFLDLFESGLIVEDLRPNAYDPKLGTAIADADIYYEDRKTRLNDVKWTVKETGEPIVISTTRPELIAACRAVLVHPDNAATKHLVGKHAVLPAGVHGRTGPDTVVPIQAHPHVKTDFGSGIMMVCSYGDQADVGLFRELQLDPIAAIGMDGKMKEVAGPLAGLKVEEARKKAIELLEAAGLMAGHKEVDQKFPKSERSGAAVELILLKEWYVKQTHCTGDLRRIAADIDFHPAKHRQLLLDWIDTVTIDWPISRRRWYHTEIPLWLLRGEGDRETQYVVVPPKGPYHQPWLRSPPAGSRVLDRTTRKDLGPLEAFLAQHKGLHVQGETKVFDTWMDSSVSNLYILRQYQDQPWAKDHTCSVRPQGRDIVRTWLYYTVLKSHLLGQGKAFEHAWITGLGMDKQGRKMSKSLGNVIDPDEVVKKVGSDAFRLWIAGESTVGDDFRINEEKIAGAGKFLQKLANVAAFVGKFPQPAAKPTRLQPADEWILGELDAVTKEATDAYAALDFFTPVNGVRSFIWNTFAPHYLEMVKGRAYNGDPAACWTLHHVLRTALLLLAPITPFCSHYYGHGVYGLDVHRAAFPAAGDHRKDSGTTDAIVAFNGQVWKAKQEKGLSLGAPLEGMAVPAPLKPFESELRDMHKLA